MYNEQIEALISAALTDGVLTEKEKQILFKKAQAQGIDLDEFEMVLDARLVELKKAEKANQSSKKSNKHGEIRKCPNCGATVPVLATICPECKMEFSGIEANSSAQKLAAQIDDIITSLQKQEKDYHASLSFGKRFLEGFMGESKFNPEKRVAQVIKNFPIPNTKSDLFEFIISLQSKINDGNEDYDFDDAYKAKLDECVKKAEILFSKDQQMFDLCKNVAIQELSDKLDYSDKDYVSEEIDRIPVPSSKAKLVGIMSVLQDKLYDALLRNASISKLHACINKAKKIDSTDPHLAHFIRDIEDAIEDVKRKQKKEKRSKILFYLLVLVTVTIAITLEWVFLYSRLEWGVFWVICLNVLVIAAGVFAFLLIENKYPWNTL